MHSFRSPCQQFKLHRCATHLLNKFVQTSIKTCCRTFSATEIPAATTTAATNVENQQFKAAVLHPKKQNLTLETLVLPEKAADGMVRVGIDYCAVNSFDVKCIYQDINTITLPFIPGSEFSGEILEVGPNCQRQFKVGDKVAVLGVRHIGGGFSHQCFVPETECIRVDPRVSQADAATIIQGYSNALLAFSKYAPLKEGDNIIICAGPGGDGLAAIEVAHKVFKANIFVVFTSKSMTALVRDESAHQAINCNIGLTKVYNFLKNSTNSKQFSAVYDTYDSKLLHVIADFIAPNGHILTEDPFFSPETFEPPYFKKDTGKKVKKKQATLDEIEAPESVDWTERVRRVDITRYQHENFKFYEKIVNQAFDLHATEKIQPFVTQEWSLRDINKAVQFVNQKKCLGKVLINTHRTEFEAKQSKQ